MCGAMRSLIWNCKWRGLGFMDGFSGRSGEDYASDLAMPLLVHKMIFRPLELSYLRYILPLLPTFATVKCLPFLPSELPSGVTS